MTLCVCRCSLAVRVGWCYQHLSSKAPHRTVVSVLADRMEWSMTGIQVVDRLERRIPNWRFSVFIGL